MKLNNMVIHEFGKDNKDIIVLIHPALVRWDYFEYVIPLLEDHYHLIVPALPGYDGQRDFSSVEQIAEELENELLNRGFERICGIYGCSMGGAVVIRMLYDNRIEMNSAVIDGGITPYQLPWIVTRVIAVRDFLMIYLGKLGGIRLLEKAFATDEYSEEDLKYIADVLDKSSAKTIWRTFESCNNYSLPEKLDTKCEKIEYWYAEAEEKERKWDMEFVKNNMPQTVFRRFENIGHGGLAALKPQLLVTSLEELMKKGNG